MTTAPAVKIRLTAATGHWQACHAGRVIATGFVPVSTSVPAMLVRAERAADKHPDVVAYKAAGGDR